ncbi:MAG: ATPase, T2SS/T4P/T4SS family [Vulcanimicrobiota bacterium]
MKEDLLTMAEAAEALNTTRNTLYRWLREGRLSARKIGRQWRFERAELDRFLRGQAPHIDLLADPGPFLDQLESLLAGPPPRTADPLLDAFNRMLKVALERQADSLHLGRCYTGQGPERQCWLRGRVDGELQLLARLDNRLLAPLVEQWKRAAACDVRETSLPQDGRILVETDRGLLDLRVSFLPSAQGETLTVKLQNRDQSQPDLSTFGLRQVDLARLRQALRKRARLVIIAGDESRDSLLAACLGEVAGPNLKLMTIENPAWLTLPWATQVSLASVTGANRSQASALRALMRSDPDVIGLAALPDPEAFEAAQTAALRGALVVAGMAGRDCRDVFSRLSVLAGSARALAQTVELILVQRLVRKLCPHCSQPQPLSEAEFESLQARVDFSLPREFRRAVGCDRCQQSGYRGRVLLAESLPFTARVFEGEFEPSDLETQTLALAAQGETSLDELERFLLVRA